MSDLYTIAAVGLLNGQQRLETISQNAASASVPGFKRQVAPAPSRTSSTTSSPTPSFAAQLSASDARQTSHRDEAASRATPRVDLRAGPMSVTGRALDVSIDSSDLFFALSDGTSTWLSRAGAFRIDADGLLVGERGLRVQGTGGDIRPGSAEVEIRPDGQILRDGVAVAALQLFAPVERAGLAPAGGALLTASAGVLPAESGQVRLRAGTLENSNASASTEMVDLLTLTRQFESLVRVTQGYDELLGRTIQKLGDV